MGIEKDNKNQIFIKDNWIHSLQEVVIEEPEVDILEKIKKAKSKDEEGKSERTIREQVADRGRLSIEERKDICTKEQRIESRNNLVASWCASSRT